MVLLSLLSTAYDDYFSHFPRIKKQVLDIEGMDVEKNLQEASINNIFV